MAVQGATICQEGGRYKLVSDGDNNNMIMLAITKVKTTDEGEYRVVIENEHGSDEKSFMLYVSGRIITSTGPYRSCAALLAIPNPLLVILVWSSL